MHTMINVILPVFLVAGVSGLAQRWLKLDVGTLSRVSFHLFVPALVLDVLLRPEFDGGEFGRIAAATLIVSLLLGVLFEGGGRLLGVKPELRGALVVAVLMTNAGTYGLPVLRFAFGEAALVPASAYLLAFNAILLLGAGLYLSLLSRTSLRGAFLHLARSPILYAALIGGLLRSLGMTLPDPLLKAVGLLGETAVSLMLVVMGLQLAQAAQEGWHKAYLPAMLAVLVGRFVVAPPLSWWVGSLVGLEGLAHRVFLLDNAFPSAILAGVLASEYEADGPFATLSVFVTTLVSLVAVTFWLHWVQ
ncbi:MAG: AEC family transporter [Anaerolineae bacterium]